MREGTREQDASDTFHHPDRVMDEALDWLVRMEAGGHVSKAVQADFDAWLRTSDAHQKAWNEISGVWSAPETLIAAQELDIHLRQQPVPLKPAGSRPARRLVLASRNFAAAASVFVILAASLLAWHFLPRMTADYTTSTGERREIALPDGSRMVLNTNSAVALDFESGQRGVRILEGEAWFDVVHDASHPFHVDAAYSEVRVKGTAFSVRADSDGDTVRLQRGSVEVVHERKELPAVHLAPGELVVATEKAISPVGRFDGDDGLSWLHGRIAIEKQPLAKALAEIGRYFDGRIFVLNPALRDTVVSGDYRTDRPQVAIESLATAAGGKVTVIPGGYIIIR